MRASSRTTILFRIGGVKRPVTRTRKISEYVAMPDRGETIKPQGSKPPRG